MPIKTKKKTIGPSEIRLSGVPSIMLIKTPEKINKTKKKKKIKKKPK